MKKVLFLLIFMGAFVKLFSQDYAIERIEIIDVGSSSLINGRAEIKCNSCDNKDNYYVTLTDIAQPLELYVAEKNAFFFVVESKTKTTGNFDYIITQKKIIPVSNSKKQ